MDNVTSLSCTPAVTLEMKADREQSLLFCFSIFILFHCHFAILLFRHFVILSFFHFVILLFFHSVILSSCSSVILFIMFMNALLYPSQTPRCKRNIFQRLQHIGRYLVTYSQGIQILLLDLNYSYKLAR